MPSDKQDSRSVWIPLIDWARRLGTSFRSKPNGYGGVTDSPYIAFLKRHPLIAWTWLAGPAGRLDNTARPKHDSAADETDKTIRRAMFSMLGFALFSLLTIGQEDQKLISGQGLVKVPFAGVEVPFVLFLVIGPLVMLGLAIYLHVFVGLAGRWARAPKLPRLLFIFNQRGAIPKIVSWLLIYALTPAIIVAYAWKALPVMVSRYLVPLAFGSVVVFLMVMIRRCSFPIRLFMVPILIGAGTFVIWVSFEDVSCRAGVWYGVYPRLNSIGTTATMTEGYAEFARPHNVGCWNRPLQLVGSDLSGIKLNGVSLRGANLREVTWTKPNATPLDAGDDQSARDAGRISLDRESGYTLRQQRTEKVRLRGRNMGGSDLTGANLQGSDLSGFQFHESELDGANLSDTNLYGAELFAASLRNANLQESILRDANLADANLTNANLASVDFSGALLEGAVFDGADVQQADFSKTSGVTKTQLLAACIGRRGVTPLFPDHPDFYNLSLLNCKLDSE